MNDDHLNQSDENQANAADDAAEQTPSDAALALEELKNRARTLGIAFHPSIGEEKLREKIRAKLDEDEKQGAAAIDAAAPASGDANGTAAQAADDAAKAAVAKALVRVRITCMDPSKKEYDGEIFSVSNSVVGTVKRYIPFGHAWHIEQIMLNMLRDKKYQAFHEVKTPGGGTVKRGRLVPAYAIETLPALSEKELAELKQRQLARQSAEGI